MRGEEVVEAQAVVVDADKCINVITYPISGIRDDAEIQIERTGVKRQLYRGVKLPL